MATRAISADVKAAYSKLAQFLRRQEEEENILQIGKRKRKPKQVREERLPGDRGRWQLEPDWKAPTPMVDRPRTIAGATSFHFSYISIAKQGVPTVNGEPVEGQFGQARNPALEHSKYIERDGAAEVSQGADHANYIERPGAAEMLDPAALIAGAHERTIAAIINGTPTPDEAELLGIEAVAPEGIPSVFSNISDDPFERQEFWRAVERVEREPKSHQIILEPDLASAWWAELEATNLLPDDFKSHALNVKEAYRQYLAEPTPEGRSKKPFEAEPFTVNSERAGRVIEAAQRMASYNPFAPPFEFKSGRGGRIQFRMVAELPHEISAEDRALIVQNFCDHLATVQERRNLDGTTYKTGMMYTAVIHAPDAHNDSRNYHLHVVAYDRPAVFMPEHGQWDFEVQEVYKDPGSRKDRVRYPYRQAKLQDMARTEDGRDPETTGKNFVPVLRAKFAEINNAVLKARGVKRRVDPRKYSEMGIDRTPTQHLGTKAAALEAIGVPTTVGQLNALAIWSDAERAIRYQVVQAGKALNKVQQELDKLAQAATKADPRNASLAALRPLLVERARLIADVAEDREAIMTFDHMEAKAKSRAIRTRQTCLQFLTDIENGTAPDATRTMRLSIEDRWKSAQQHIETIDAALAPHREALAKAARDIVAREQRIREIDRAIEPMRAALQSVATAEREARAKPTKEAAAKNDSRATTSVPLPSANDRAEPTEFEVPTIASSCSPEPMSANDPGVPYVAIKAPASIEGLPIVEPTIAPNVEPTLEPSDVTAETPEGLAPIRPIAVPEQIIPGEQIITPDLEDLAAERAAPASPDKPVEATKDQAPVQPAEPKVDRRKEDQDPALFSLPAPDTLAMPATSRSAYVDFDALIARVMNNRIPIHAVKGNNGKTTFIVPTLNDEERQLIANPRFAHRANERFRAIHDRQRNEIDRVVRWISSTGQNPDLLKLEGRSAKLGAAVKDSVKTLFRHWGKHAEVVQALRNEFDRRVELAATQVAEVKLVSPIEAPDRAEIKAEAAKLYPEADQAFTPEVAEFITLLRNAATNDELQEAAEKIRSNPRSREDIQKHNVHLATAYHRLAGGVPHKQVKHMRGLIGRAR